MTKKAVTRTLRELYSKLGERYDMHRHEVGELKIRQCVDRKMKPYIAAECIVVNKKTYESDIVTFDISYEED